MPINPEIAAEEMRRLCLLERETLIRKSGNVADIREQLEKRRLQRELRVKL